MLKLKKQTLIQQTKFEKRSNKYRIIQRSKQKSTTFKLISYNGLHRKLLFGVNNNIRLFPKKKQTKHLV